MQQARRLGRAVVHARRGAYVAWRGRPAAVLDRGHKQEEPAGLGEDRVARRKEEIESLQEALKILQVS